MRRAVTIIEVLIVCGIILILGAIVFAVMAPARASARHGVCASNQRQVFVAALNYASDFDGGSYPEIGMLTYIPLDQTGYFRREYVKDRSLMTCPDWPADGLKLAHTYHINFLASLDGQEPTPADSTKFPPFRRFMMSMREIHGADTPMIYCTTHDELEYQPKEGRKGDPWVIWVRDDGSIKKGRLKGGPRLTRARPIRSVGQGQERKPQPTIQNQ